MLGKLILLIAVILICCKSFLYNTGSRQDDKKILILAFIMLAFIFGCQDVETTGSGDIKEYYETYEHAIDSNSLFSYIEEETYMDNGYLVIMWFLSRIIRWRQFILFFEAVFCFGITLRFIYKYSEDVLLSVLGFMAFGTMGFYQTAYRQSMAISLCLLAMEMADKKRWKTFLVLVLIAMSVHQTAIIFLPAYFIIKIRVNKLLVIIGTGMIFLLQLCAPFLFNLGNQLFHRDFSMVYTGNKAGGIINIGIGLFIVFTMTYQRGSHKINGNAGQKDVNATVHLSSNQKFLYLLIMGIGLYSLRYRASIMERISFYFTPLMFIMLPDAIQNGFAEKDRRLLKIFFVAGMLFLISRRFGARDFLPFWLGITG